MTALLRLRAQMLVALGLPACWTQSAPQEPTPPPPVEPVVVRPLRKREPIVSFTPESCMQDTIVETVCGVGESRYCEAKPGKSTLDSYRRLPLTEWSTAESERATFHYDEPETIAWRERGASRQSDAEEFPCCFSRCTPLTVGRGSPQVPSRPDQAVVPYCIPTPPAGTARPDPNVAACPMGVRIRGETRPFSTLRGGECCYDYLTVRYNPGGRPARVDGEARFAALGTASAWMGDLTVDVSALAPTVRAQLAEAWLASARMEHASVAAFSSVALRLLALGAPPDLVAATHAAALDEIAHAQIAFALASAYAGTPLGPADFPAATQLASSASLAELVRETFVDGCIGETVAALEAERAAEVAADPALAAALRQIAADEARHAELAWRIVAWGVQLEPALAALLVAPADPVPVLATPDDATLAAHGQVGPVAHARAVAEVLATVVAPCVSAIRARDARARQSLP